LLYRAHRLQWRRETDVAGRHPPFDRLYAGDDALRHAFHEGEFARRQLFAGMKEDICTANNGAPTPIGFSKDTERLAALMAGDRAVQLAFLQFGGWHTRLNQGAALGQRANHLKPLGEGLAALVKGPGPIGRDTVIVVISEFGGTPCAKTAMPLPTMGT
jgi:uncharacterized protein (DUF1501 family)